MKTLFTLSLAAVCALSTAAYAETTVLAEMDELVSGATIGSGVTLDTSLTGTVYTFDGTGSIYGITNEAIQNAINSGTGILTIAAWVKQDAHADNMIFSTGGQSNGFMFGIDNGGLKFTAKEVADKIPGWSVASDTWTLVAIGINLSESGDSRFYQSATNGQFYTRALDGWNDNDPQTFAIGSGNSDGNRDTFTGSIANLTVIYSDALLNNSEIATYVGAMPIPEPATATLSLLALAGLAARRRRK